MNRYTYRQARFRQADLLNATTNTAAADGICHVLAMKWASTIVLGKGHSAADRMRICREHPNEVMMLFTAFGNRWDHEGGRNADQGAAHQLGLTVTKLERLGNRAQVVAQIRAARHTGFVYSFWWADGAGHSIGIYRTTVNKWFRSKGYIQVFEPNYGEYYMHKSKFARWLRWLEGEYQKGPFTKHQIRHLAARNEAAIRNAAQRYGGVQVMPGL